MTYMYIGPTIPGTIRKNEVFRDKIPDRIKKADNPDMEKLIIPIDNVIAARETLNDRHSVLAVTYSNILKKR